MASELPYLSASQAIALFQSRQLSPRELMEAIIEQTEATEPRINAFVDTYFDEAILQSEAAADAYLARTAKPLEGIPVAIKDEPRIAGRRWTQGSLIYRDEIATQTDPITQRLLDAGAIAHAHTTTPEFSMAIVTWTHLHGITRNPWNPDLTPGGSSGGSGASLAAGTSLLATGSDIAGSIRIPAALNGLVGFKPPWGRVPDFWPWNREPYAASGPMARTVPDVILMENVISGPLPFDMYAAPPLDIPAQQPAIDGMRIAMSTNLGYFDPDEVVATALRKTAEHLRELGAVVDEIDLGWTREAEQTALTHLDFQSRRILERAVESPQDERLTPYIRDFFARPAVSVEQWMESWRYGDEMYRLLQERAFSLGYQNLICPTLATTNIPADLGHPDSDTPAGWQSQLELAMTYPFNVLGRLPVANIPIGLDPSNGVPIGMQIVGPVEADAVPLRVAQALEDRFGNFFERHRPEVGNATDG